MNKNYGVLITSNSDLSNNFVKFEGVMDWLLPYLMELMISSPDSKYYIVTENPAINSDSDYSRSVEYLSTKGFENWDGLTEIDVLLNPYEQVNADYVKWYTNEVSDKVKRLITVSTNKRLKEGAIELEPDHVITDYKTDLTRFKSPTTYLPYAINRRLKLRVKPLSERKFDKVVEDIYNYEEGLVMLSNLKYYDLDETHFCNASTRLLGKLLSAGTLTITVGTDLIHTEVVGDKFAFTTRDSNYEGMVERVLNMDDTEYDYVVNLQLAKFIRKYNVDNVYSVFHGILFNK